MRWWILGPYYFSWFMWIFYTNSRKITSHIDIINDLCDLTHSLWATIRHGYQIWPQHFRMKHANLLAPLPNQEFFLEHFSFDKIHFLLLVFERRIFGAVWANIIVTATWCPLASRNLFTQQSSDIGIKTGGMFHKPSSYSINFFTQLITVLFFKIQWASLVRWPNWFPLIKFFLGIWKLTKCRLLVSQVKSKINQMPSVKSVISSFL